MNLIKCGKKALLSRMEFIMTNKDIKRIEKAMERVVKDILHIEYDEEDDEATIPMSIIDEIEEFLLFKPIYLVLWQGEAIAPSESPVWMFSTELKLVYK